MAHARTSGSSTRGTSSGVLVRVNIVSCQVHRCIAPAQGYTQNNQRLLGKAGQNTDRTDRGIQIEKERPAKRHILTRSISGRYFRERSVSILCGSITYGNTDRKKVLQMTILLMIQAMRAVFC
jgi:hypothetical protein